MSEVLSASAKFHKKTEVECLLYSFVDTYRSIEAAFEDIWEEQVFEVQGGRLVMDGDYKFLVALNYDKYHVEKCSVVYSAGIDMVSHPCDTTVRC